MEKIEFYRNKKEMRKGSYSIELLILIFIIVIASFMSASQAYKNLPADEDSSATTLCILLCIACLIVTTICSIFICTFIYVSELRNFRFFFSLRHSFLKWNRDFELSMKESSYKFLVRSFSGDNYLCSDFKSFPDGRAEICEEDDLSPIWDRKKMNCHYFEIIDLSDMHTLTCAKIKKHAAEYYRGNTEQ